MATAETQTNPVEDSNPLLKKWLERLGELVAEVEVIANDLGWSTRRIEKKMEDSNIGTYKAPALLLQRETTKVMLEPIARTSPGTEGVVDLYLMPQYDDIASLYFYDAGWQLHYPYSDSPIAATLRDAGHKPLSRDTLREVLGVMIENAS